MNKIITLFVLTLLAINLQGQRNCGSMENLQQQIERNPQIQENLDRLEQFTKEYIQDPDKAVSGGILTIPVIVHVVYQNSTENISDNRIADQIQVLNEDFRRQNSDQDNIWPQAADSEIEFCLVQTIRKPTSVNSFGTNDSVKFSSSGGSDVVNPASSLNIWVCEIGGNILGYAQFPGGSPSTDGVVIDYRYFGTNGAIAPFNLGRTTTHEVGHWLNLRHIWGDGGCNQDDSVSDTPKAGGPNYTGSPCSFPGPNSCTPKGRPGQPDDYDMFQNYMDYSDDECMNLFTSGQKDRMWAAVNGARPALLTSPCDGGPPPAVEICDNGIDDDNDGDVDCDDSDCTSAPNCVDPGTCDAPSNLQHTRRKGGKEALLEWNAVSSATSYDVEVFNSGGALHASGNVTSNAAVVGGLTKNAAYTWQVRANCSGGQTSAWTGGSFTARIQEIGIAKNEIKVFPNPSNTSEINLTWDMFENSDSKVGIYENTQNYLNQGPIHLQIRDLTGKIIYTNRSIQNSRSLQIDISQFNAGMYIIQVSNKKGYLASTKFVKL